MTIIAPDSVATCYRSPARLAPLLLGLLLCSRLAVPAQSFNVTAFNNDNYSIGGQNDPTLTLQRGVTYVFNLTGLGTHPFWIKTSLGLGAAGAYNTGTINNGGTSGTVTFTVPANAPNQLLYQCGNHFDMTGTLTIVTPATPPTVRIVYINVAQFITIKSTGTNGWSASPEFKCFISAPSWSPVANFTNTFNAGTNTTTFPRLDPICGSTNVFIRIRNQSN